MKPVNPNSTNSWRTHAGFALHLAQKRAPGGFPSTLAARCCVVSALSGGHGTLRHPHQLPIADERL